MGPGFAGPGLEVSASGKVSKFGAIYHVPLDVIVAGLKAVGALPTDAKCEVHPGTTELILKVRSDYLPLVGQAQPYARRRAVRGRPTGEEMR